MSPQKIWSLSLQYFWNYCVNSKVVTHIQIEVHTYGTPSIISSSLAWDNNQCCIQGLTARGQEQGQELEAQGQGRGLEIQGQEQGLEVLGQGLVNWFSWILQDKDFPRGLQY